MAEKIRPFKTKYDKHDRTETNPGSRFSPTFALSSKVAGIMDLEIVGEVDIYESIQSHRESVDIKNIMKRFELGETNLLKPDRGMIVDITNVPTNIPDVMKIVLTAKQQFDSLPMDIRETYNFSPEEFIADIGSLKWNSLMYPEQPKPTDDKGGNLSNE